ncbi:hypothetical protein MHTCC0001_20800 [Flavobacteriaceae bacterium MHTCC 0001]
MKHTHLYTLLFTILLLANGFAQSNTMIQNTNNRNKASNTLSNNFQKSDKAISKAIIKDVSTKVKAYISGHQIAKAKAFIQSNRSKCDSLKSSKLCHAGLNFHSGYLYQQAAKLDTANTKAFQQNAIKHYEKVLDAFPGNKAALNNLIKLNAAKQNNNASINRVAAFIEQTPAEAVTYYLRMGDLFQNEGNLDMACDFYSKAYKKDPRSGRTCKPLVALYTENDFTCSIVSNIREFAQDCNVIGFPNYSEELLRKESTLHIKNEKELKAIQSILLWADVMAENGWLFPEKVQKLTDLLFPKGTELSASNKRLKQILKELEFIAQSKTIDTIGDLTFWKNFEPRVSSLNNSKPITPQHVLLKIYHNKGEKAYFKKDYNTAENFWTEALHQAKGFDNVFFTIVASDLARLYYSKSKNNEDNHKLDDLVVNLFEMKGAAYEENDLDMIRQYHMTLGAIYYAQEKWEGGYATNAEFQLRHAVSDKFGPVVNPKLREMLGDVYRNLGKTKQAVDAYDLSIQDYLSLDRIKKASDLHAKTKTTMPLNPTQTKTYETTGAIINWRKDFANSNNAVIKGSTSLSDYLNEVLKAEKKTKMVLQKDFVSLQFFKGLCDLGSQLENTRVKEQQIIYTHALNNVKNTHNLPSEQDYYRVIEINNSLLKSLNQPKKLETTQMYKKGNLSSYNTKTVKKSYTTYNVPTLNKEVIIPNKLFKLNKQLQKDNKNINTSELVKYKLNNRGFELNKIDNRN